MRISELHDCPKCICYMYWKDCWLEKYTSVHKVNKFKQKSLSELYVQEVLLRETVEDQ